MNSNNHMQSYINHQLQEHQHMANHNLSHVLQHRSERQKRDERPFVTALAGAKVGGLTAGPLGLIIGGAVGLIGGLLINEIDK